MGHIALLPLLPLFPKAATSEQRPGNPRDRTPEPQYVIHIGGQPAEMSVNAIRKNLLALRLSRIRTHRTPPSEMVCNRRLPRAAFPRSPFVCGRLPHIKDKYPSVAILPVARGLCETVRTGRPNAPPEHYRDLHFRADNGIFMAHGRSPCGLLLPAPKHLRCSCFHSDADGDPDILTSSNLNVNIR